MSDAGRHGVITAYLLAFGGMLLLGGRISGALGHRRASCDWAPTPISAA